MGSGGLGVYGCGRRIVFVFIFYFTVLPSSSPRPRPPSPPPSLENADDMEVVDAGNANAGQGGEGAGVVDPMDEDALLAEDDDFVAAVYDNGEGDEDDINIVDQEARRI